MFGARTYRHRSAHRQRRKQDHTEKGPSRKKPAFAPHFCHRAAKPARQIGDLRQSRQRAHSHTLRPETPVNPIIICDLVQETPPNPLLMSDSALNRALGFIPEGSSPARGSGTNPLRSDLFFQFVRRRNPPVSAHPAPASATARSGVRPHQSVPSPLGSHSGQCF